MHCFGYVYILILCSVVILEKSCHARLIQDNGYRAVFDEQERSASRQLNKRQINCPGPYHVLTRDQRCVWSCANGTQPDTTTNECICKKSYYQTNTDKLGRRICEECPRPYHVLTSDGCCVWSCGVGTQPDSTTNQCVCQPGYYETGSDQFGRRICSNCVGPYHVLTSDGRCVWSCGVGTQPDSTTNQCVCQPGYYETGIDQFGRRVCSITSTSK